MLQAQSFFIRRIQASIKNLRNTVSDVLAYYEAVFGDMSEATYTELKVILNELLINAIKHGSKEDEGKHINVIADLTADKYALLVVEDEGEGYDTSFIERDDFSDYGSFGSFISAGADAAQAGVQQAGAPQTDAQLGAPQAGSQQTGAAQSGAPPAGAPQTDASQAGGGESGAGEPGGGALAGGSSGASQPDGGAPTDEEAQAALDALFGIEETGRGIQIVRNLCDDFMVNSKGNKVVVKKRLRRY
ncbi:MAG: ATP-binding protein [Clostridiales bacterium]|nr:ATP-binding protein [Clostridiales bacterium]